MHKIAPVTKNNLAQCVSSAEVEYTLLHGSNHSMITSSQMAMGEQWNQLFPLRWSWEGWSHPHPAYKLGFHYLLPQPGQVIALRFLPVSLGVDCLQLFLYVMMLLQEK
jgi:hypothetical protein